MKFPIDWSKKLPNVLDLSDTDIFYSSAPSNNVDERRSSNHSAAEGGSTGIKMGEQSSNAAESTQPEMSWNHKQHDNAQFLGSWSHLLSHVNNGGNVFFNFPANTIPNGVINKLKDMGAEKYVRDYSGNARVLYGFESDRQRILSIKEKGFTTMMLHTPVPYIQKNLRSKGIDANKIADATKHYAKLCKMKDQHSIIGVINQPSPAFDSLHDLIVPITETEADIAIPGPKSSVVRNAEGDTIGEKDSDPHVIENEAGIVHHADAENDKHESKVED
jgi:membrane protease subunit (stomatin/prohibitin family)